MPTTRTPPKKGKKDTIEPNKTTIQSEGEIESAQKKPSNKDKKDAQTIFQIPENSRSGNPIPRSVEKNPLEKCLGSSFLHFL